MPTLKLTARGVETLSTEYPQEDFHDTVTPGLILRVSGATDRKVWSVRYRTDGARKRYKLGTYPHMGLSDSREAAREAIRRADAGEDPAEERRERREGTRSFASMAEEVLEARKAKTRPATREERRRILERELLPAWKGREASSINRREVVHLVERIATRGAPVLANRTLALIKLLFNDGIRRGFPGVETSPAALLEPPQPEDGRDRYLTTKEIQAFWRATEHENPATRGAFRLALLTGQRIGSVCSMRWDIVAGDLWTIPVADFKGRRPHLVPLSAEALEVLAWLRDLTETDDAGKPLSPHVFPSRENSKHPHLTNVGKALTRVRERSKLPHWTLHDFRTTFRTHATRSAKDNPPGLGLPGQIADAVLGHKEATLGFSRYTGDRDRYLLMEKREALEKWSAFVRTHVEANG